MTPRASAMFAENPASRRETVNRRFLSVDVLTVVVDSVIARAAVCEVIAEYGRIKEPFSLRFLEPPDGVPSPDPLARIFASSPRRPPPWRSVAG